VPGGSVNDVLVVDDFEIIRDLMVGMISDQGYMVQSAENGLQAVEKARVGNFKIIFMDCDMPVMDGFRATSAIRKMKLPNRPLIVALTANALPEQREECLRIGMDAYLTKPIDREALFNTLDELADDSEETNRSDSRAKSHDPVFDLSAALDALEGDSNLLGEIVEISLRQFPKHMENIRAGVSGQDPKALEHAAHALKGSAANLLARRVMEAAARIEEIGRAGSTSVPKEDLASLENELAKLQTALGEFEKDYARS